MFIEAADDSTRCRGTYIGQAVPPPVPADVIIVTVDFMSDLN
jgi:hypothetical protein